jgi:hypothetical protein
MTSRNFIKLSKALFAAVRKPFGFFFPRWTTEIVRTTKSFYAGNQKPVQTTIENPQ